MRKTTIVLGVTSFLWSVAGIAAADDCAHLSLLKQLVTSPLQVVSTVPANGDLDPCGVAFVPRRFPSGGKIGPGDILVLNFNNSANLQGTGTTIASITRDGMQTVFFQGPTGFGLTTAPGVLRSGIVLVGNVPAGTSGTVQQGSHIAIDRFGHQIAQFTESTLLDGPWDLVLIDHGREATVLVLNILNGTVSHLDFDVSWNGEQIALESVTQIANGYLHRTYPAALVIGPTGVAFDRETHTLFVASTGDNAIYSDPTLPSELVEFTREGHFVAQLSVDAGGRGGAFGIAIHSSDGELRVAAVDDVVNTFEALDCGRVIG